MTLVSGIAIAFGIPTKGLSVFACMPIVNSIWKKRQPIKLGCDGERAVRRRLEQLLPENITTLHDIVVRNTQIDHLVIGPGGIIVIETKNWSGKCHVRRYDSHWAVESARTSLSSERPSPSRQNYGHQRRIRELLSVAGIQENVVSGIVLFAPDPITLSFDECMPDVKHLNDVSIGDFNSILKPNPKFDFVKAKEFIQKHIGK
jgi:hypothetical protein